MNKIFIPFKNREKNLGKIAVVIMKSPSKAKENVREAAKFIVC
jgi:hypothetical protein